MSSEQTMQFKPARAKKRTTGPLSGFDTEQKLDGQRYVLHPHTVTSRRESVHGGFVEKGGQVPHLRTKTPHTLFDSECVSIGDAIWMRPPSWAWDALVNPGHPHMLYFRERGSLPVFPHVSLTTEIMGCAPAEAVARQKERGLIWAFCFDVLFYEGKYLGNNTERARRNFLAEQLAVHHPDPEQGVVLMPRWRGLSPVQQRELFDMFVSVEGEGLVLKDPDRPYDHAQAWWKWKAEWPVDVVLTGRFEYGNEGRTGKMLGKVGTLEIGVYQDEYLEPIGWISAIGLYGERNLQRVADEAVSGRLRGRVIEIITNGLQSKSATPLGYTLRHPRFSRFRDDKNAVDCTFAALYGEIMG